MQKMVVVLRGGVGSEHDVSLKSGAQVLQQLGQGALAHYKTKDVFIDRHGIWHVRGIPLSPERALADADVVWNALHGEYGEDGQVQRILERIGIPYTGSGVYASSVGMNKVLTKKVLQEVGIKTPYAMTLDVSDILEQDICNAFRRFPLPSIIKPTSGGSSVGTTLARDFFSFESGIKKAFSISPQVLIEEYIQGKEATLGVVEGLRGEMLYALPPVEIIPPPDASFFTYEAKYTGKTLERCPGLFSVSETDEMKNIAKTTHTLLGLKHYSRSDFIVSSKGIYFLEVNTLPGLTAESLLPKSLAAVGVSLPEFFDHVLKLAIARK